MTPRERDLFYFIKSNLIETGISPTFDEMRSVLGVASKSRISMLVESLIIQNRLRRKKGHGAARNLEIVQHCCPHCGKDLQNG